MSLESYKSAVQSMVSDTQSEIQKTIELVARIRRFVKDTSINDFDDIVDTSSLSDGFASAVENAQTLMDNPLANMIEKEFAEQYGITTGNVLSIAQSLLRGSESPMLQVIVAMITMPGRAQEFIVAAKKLRDSMRWLSDYIRNNIPGGDNLQRASVITIPPDVIIQIETIRNNLVRSMSYPFNTKLYSENMEAVLDAADALENVPCLKNVKQTAAATAAIVSLNALAVLVSPTGKVITDLGLRVITDINVILLTDLSVRTTSTAKFNTAKKAVARISQILSQMKSTDVDQLILLPKYISILNVAYMLLKTGKPAPDTDPLSFDHAKIKLTAGTVRSIQSSCRKMVVFTQSPYSLSALDAEVGRLSQYIQTMESELADTITGIQEIEDAGWGDKFNLIRLMFEYLENYAMATSLLADGAFSTFLELDEMRATAEGAAVAAMLELAALCDSVFMTQQARWFRKKAADLSRKAKSKALKNESKKEKRKNKANDKLKEINVLLEDMTELYATVSGVAGTLAGLIEE